jgi:hypothetical protein
LLTALNISGRGRVFSASTRCLLVDSKFESQFRLDYSYHLDQSRGPTKVPSYNGNRATMGTVLQWVPCYNGYRVSSPGVKRPERGTDHPSSPCVQVQERVELYLNSLSVSSWHVTNRTDLYVEYQSDLLCNTFTRNAVLFVTKRTANVTSCCKCQLP